MIALVVAMLGLWSPHGPAAAQESLPLEVRTDLAMITLERAVTQGDNPAILAAIDDLRALAPALAAGELLFFEAEAALATGDVLRAEAALVQFVSSVGRTSELYPLALEMLLDVQASAGQLVAAREALAACEAATTQDMLTRYVVDGTGAETAIALCRDAVALDAGNGRANYLLAEALDSAGRQDEALAAYRTASDAGDVSAMGVLGYTYLYGTGVARDPRAAQRHFLRAVDAGSVIAHYWLYVLHALPQSGGGLPDASQALFHLRSAAEAGLAQAMGELGDVYTVGSLGPQDFAEAVRWHRAAIEAGLAGSLAPLARLYAAGQGVERDPARAAALFLDSEQAGARGFRLSVANLDRETIVEFQRLLREAGHDPGEVEGLYTPQTWRALNAYLEAE